MDTGRGSVWTLGGGQCGHWEGVSVDTGRGSVWTLGGGQCGHWEGVVFF